ncbi:MAG: histidine phosphatase family protein [Proteobacteria bacterium]|jgi:broad specificity phosphatase PhoE|nr:histidine phosphatase family protein [Pseudomonadota bacterium]
MASPTTTKWIFVRHGESIANHEGWLAGHRDAPLTQQGRIQAVTLAAALSSMSFCRAFSSDLSRAEETARLALQHSSVSLVVTRELRERDLGEWEGAYFAELRARGVFDRLLTWTGAPPAGESQRDVAYRVTRWLDPIDNGQSTILFAHGGLIRSILGLIDEVPYDQIGVGKVANATPQVRNIQPGFWRQTWQKLEEEGK